MIFLLALLLGIAVHLIRLGRPLAVQHGIKICYYGFSIPVLPKMLDNVLGSYVIMTVQSAELLIGFLVPKGLGLIAPLLCRRVAVAYYACVCFVSQGN